MSVTICKREKQQFGDMTHKNKVCVSGKRPPGRERSPGKPSHKELTFYIILRKEENKKIHACYSKEPDKLHTILCFIRGKT